MEFHFETERLFLREIHLEDLEDILALDSTPKVHQFMGWSEIRLKAELIKIGFGSYNDDFSSYEDNLRMTWCKVSNVQRKVFKMQVK